MKYASSQREMCVACSYKDSIKPGSGRVRCGVVVVTMVLLSRCFRRTIAVPTRQGKPLFCATTHTKVHTNFV